MSVKDVICRYDSEKHKQKDAVLFSMEKNSFEIKNLLTLYTPLKINYYYICHCHK